MICAWSEPAPETERFGQCIRAVGCRGGAILNRRIERDLRTVYNRRLKLCSNCNDTLQIFGISSTHRDDRRK